MRRGLPDSSFKRLVVLTGARQTGKTTLSKATYPDLRSRVRIRAAVVLLGVLAAAPALGLHPESEGKGEVGMIDIQETSERIQAHLEFLTVAIGERSVRLPENLERTAAYIESFFQEIALPVHREPYMYRGIQVHNIVAESPPASRPGKRFLIGAHYDSVTGTVGADDNASAVAVLLETARNLSTMLGGEDPPVTVKFLFFALEEPPVYGSRHMGSRVYAAKARREGESIDGMICLEMVGYTCHQEGCQDYPFPLGLFKYPKKGNYIGIVANTKSRSFAQTLAREFERNRDLPVVKLTVPFNGWLMPPVRLSDHASFWDKGFKAVMITDTAFYRNPNYHTPADTMEKLDPRFMAELVESLCIFIRSFSSVWKTK